MARKPNMRRVRPQVEALESRELMTVIGAVDWTTITSADSGNHPYKMAVSIYARNSDGSIGYKIGSGAMIAPNVVLTAGHVVYDETNNRFQPAGGLYVVAGQADDYKPYGAARSVSLKSVTGYTTNRLEKYDVGVIYLDRNLGTYTGTFGLMNKSESFFDNNGFVNILHYPSDTLDGDQLVYSKGNVDHGTADFIRYALDTEHGSSGAPVYVIEDGQRYIVGMHNYGSGGDHVGLNQATRLNDFWFNKIVDWKDDRVATDKADLMDKGAWFNTNISTLSSTSVTKGGSLTVAAKIWNGGTKATGAFTVKFYASTNDTITTSDKYLGAVTFSSLTPFQTGNATWTGNLPSTLAAGYYRIGWRIDSGSAVPEYLETNNTGYVRNAWLRVTNPVYIFESAAESASVSNPVSIGGSSREAGSPNWSFLHWTLSAGQIPSAVADRVFAATTSAAEKVGAGTVKSGQIDALFAGTSEDLFGAAELGLAV